jgi:cobalt-zinc-cadmium efflux system outer membrane protein
VIAVASTATIARADDDTGGLPQTLDLAQAIAFFHAHGFDLLIAEATADSAAGDVTIADAIPNPALSLGYGRSFYNCSGCPSAPNYYSISVSDQASIEDTLSGKRRMRVDVAAAALRAARLSRTDADRTLVFQVKSQFEQVLVAQLAVKFARDTAAANAILLEKTQQQATAGKIGDADVLRVKTIKLEADQAIDQAEGALRKSRAQLAFLLGIRAAVPNLVVAEPLLEHYALPAKLAAETHDSLLQRAFAARPDLQAQEAQVASAEAQLALNKRLRFPDITLSLGYSQQGTTPSDPSPPTFSVGLSAPIPVLYRQDGEIHKYDAQLRVQRLQLAKLKTSIVNDFETAYADLLGSQALVKRMEQGELLATATAAKDAVLKAKELGAATLLDVLNAVATYIATNVEYQNDVAAYWTAVFEVEQAIGSDLR